MAWPVPIVEWKPGSPPDSTTGSWVNISTSLRRGGFSRGRSNELEQFQAGTAGLILDNRHRTFDPSTQGDLIGSPLRVSVVTPGGSTVRLFTGHVTSLPQTWSAAVKGDSVVDLEAVDAFDLMEQRRVQSPFAEVGGAFSAGSAYGRWWKLSEEAGAVTAVDSDAGYNAEILGQPSVVDSLVAADAGTALYWPSTHPGWPQGIRLPVTQWNSGPLPDGAYGSGANSSRTWVVSAWINPESTNTGGVFFVSASETETNAYSAVIRSRGGYVETVSVSTSGYAGLVTSTFSTGEPHHIVSLFHQNRVVLYVDGTLVGDSTHPNKQWWSAPDKRYRDFIAREPDGVGPFIGSIQHVMVLRYESSASTDGCPTATDIAALYTAGSAPWPGDTADVRLDRLLDQLGWPDSTGYRSLEVGQSELAPAGDDLVDQTVLAHAQAVAVDAEGGRLFVDGDGTVTFHNRHHNILSTRALDARLEVTDDPTLSSTQLGWSDLTLRYTVDDIVNRAEVTNVNGVRQEAESTASRDAYGPRLAELSEVQLASDLDAADRAAWLVQNRKDPRTRVETITVNLGQSTFAPDLGLGVAVGDRVAVTRTPSTGAAITVPAIVEGVQVDFDVQRAEAWDVTWRLTNADEGADYLILDSTTRGIIGSSTGIGNRLGY